MRPNCKPFNFQLVDASKFLCSFHREKSWIEWTGKATNGARHVRHVLLDLMRQISDASSEAAYHEAVQILKSHTLWASLNRFRNWFQNEWLSCSEV